MCAAWGRTLFPTQQSLKLKNMQLVVHSSSLERECHISSIRHAPPRPPYRTACAAWVLEFRRQMQSIDPLSVGDQLVQVDEVDPQVIVTAVESLDYTMATTATTGPQVRCGVERWKLQRCVGKRSFLHRPAQNSLSSDVPA